MTITLNIIDLISIAVLTVSYVACVVYIIVINMKGE